VEQSLSIITALVPKIGYEAAADIAKEALATRKGFGRWPLSAACSLKRSWRKPWTSGR
jgi:fumarate hydratase class II